MAAKNTSRRDRRTPATAAALADPDEVIAALRGAFELAGAAAGKPGQGKNRTRKTAGDGDGDGDGASRKVLEPGGAALTWQTYGKVWAPFCWMIHAEWVAWLAWVTGSAAGGQPRLLLLAAAALTAGLRAAYRARWEKHPDGSKGRPKRTRGAKGEKIPPWGGSRSYLTAAWAAGMGWLLLAAWHPVGPRGVTQLLLLAGGLLLASPHLHHRRYRPAAARAPGEGPPLDVPAGEDPRLAKFRRKFVDARTGPMKDADLSGFGDVPSGFAFDLKLDETTDAVTGDVIAARTKIAKLYDVPADQATVEYGKPRSEARARITVLTEPNALEREWKWDGRSSYNPRTGAFDLGLFLDSQVTHWQLNRPQSGACGGVLAGQPGSGKTGTVHVIAGEAGQARLCVECGPAGSCQQCTRARICALWMGDPQMQPLGVWRGRADLMAWGPAGCVQMIQWGHAVMRKRAAWLGDLEWTDHQGRKNKGKGWFDPLPGLPEIYIIIDEWPLIAGNPELAKIAVPLAGQIGKEGRKAGVALLFVTQIPDLTELGERAVREMLKSFNVLSHRTDGLSKFMLGIEGDPQGLPAGVHGLGLMNGMDQRAGATMRTKHCREYLQPWETGIDIREVAERIGSDPVVYDEATTATLAGLGYTGHGQVLDGAGLALDTGDDIPGLAQMMAGMPAGMPSLAQMSAMAAPLPAPPPPMVSGPASFAAVAKIADALARAGEHGADLVDLMDTTGLSALDAQRAAGALVHEGHAAQDPSGRLTAARQ